MEHPSEKARKLYLKEHPKAEPKNHTVKPEGEKSAPEEQEGGDEKAEAKPESTGGKAKSFFKGLSEKARAFVTKSSGAVQKFVADEEHRAKVMEDAAKTILASPKTYAKRLVATAKHEIHEFKEAGEALAHLAKGKKLDPKQKKVLRTVAIHMGIAVAAAALTSTGVLAGAAVFGKGMVQKIALKAAAHALENVHLVQELTHVGHGAHHLMHLLASEQDEDEEEDRTVEKVDPEEAFAILVMQSVVKEMKGLSEDDMREVLEGASGEQKEAAWKVSGAQAGDLIPTLNEAFELLDEIASWLDGFDRTLVAARSEAEGLKDRVWQDRWVRYFEERDATLEKMDLLDERLQEIYLEKTALAAIANQARNILKIPRKAQIEYAISDIDFGPNPNTNKEGISYSISRLKEWSGEAEKWVSKGQQELRGLVQKANRIIRTQSLV